MRTETRGRKTIPKENKKIPICIYIAANDIEQLGGISNLKNELINYTKTKIYVTTNHKGLHESRN
jgi:hypothetical protein